ncbi:MAG: amidohydrolase family protein [Crocinitomicaceae bacterium]|nr:amidohydrolase family protein [Flavobacteriales bacterium]NQZ34687.1 amidohydrolase family protein [Crocinitomicaceae bacterium]
MKQILFLITFVSSIAFAQESSRILVSGGNLHIGNGKVLESAVIGIEDGKIAFIKNAFAYTVDKTEWDTIIDVTGQEIYPGFVAPNSTLGLTEIDAVRATRDFDEVGTYNPHIRSQIAFNVESKVMSTVRSNGVLLTQATPRGGIISGSSAIMTTSGWNWEDATVRNDDGIHLNWPSSMQGGGWWAEPTPKSKNKKYAENKRAIANFFEMAKAYTQEKNPEKKDLRLEAMRGCFDGTKRVYIHANELQELVDVIEFAKNLGLAFPVIVGGYDSHLITEQLKDSEIPVMVVRPHSLPENEGDAVNHPYRLPALLREGGVKFCIQNEGDMEAMNARNLPFLAGTAMAYGLSEEDAVSSISLWSCEIMGIDENYGSVEKGKSATFFVSEGNALDMMTNQMTIGVVNGELIEPANFQFELKEKYTKKYSEN